ncbi:hypothetical protein OO17_25430 [Rhodopseudomonas palustris]|uniref:Uncharacterized protein n=1 Tax=Rhodopseudomonas palustris TaxID=1076 RepID=A0A0D7E4H2_RHOPL|nr:hypothetical protein OO17_25430 [Rhodopseudomonas palustris]
MRVGMLDLSSTNLLRLRQSDANSLARWLADDRAMMDFETAIYQRLKRYTHASLKTSEEIYSFGREMRQIYEQRSNQSLVFKMEASDLNERVYVLFTCGFLRLPFQLARDTISLPSSKLKNVLAEVLKPSTTIAGF